MNHTIRVEFVKKYKHNIISREELKVVKQVRFDVLICTKIMMLFESDCNSIRVGNFIKATHFLDLLSFIT